MAEPERALSALRHLPLTQVAVVYAADKVSKVREIRTSKLRRHRESLLMLEGEMLGGRMVELLRVELDALDELPRPA